MIRSIKDPRRRPRLSALSRLTLVAAVMAVVASVAQPAQAVPGPPSPGIGTLGWYHLQGEYKGDLEAVRGWSVTWQVPQLNNGTQAWAVVGQWFHNLETGIYYTPEEGWWVYYYSDNDGLAGNNSQCTVSWEVGGHCHGVMERLPVGKQLTFTYQWCGTNHVANVNGTKICAWVDMNDGVGDRFLAGDTPPAGNREMYTHDIETFGDSQLVEPAIPCSRPVVMVGQRVRNAAGQWTNVTGDSWNFHDNNPSYEYQNVNTGANPARWESCSSARKVDTIGALRPSDRTVNLRNSITAGANDIPAFTVPDPAGNIPVVGDWDGDGVDSLGHFRVSDLSLHLRNPLDGAATRDYAYWANEFAATGDVPIVGDWDGDGKDAVGSYRPSTRTFRLRNDTSGGQPDHTFVLGVAGDVPVIGDWNNDGRDGVGVFRPSTGFFYLRNALSAGAFDHSFKHSQASPNDVPVVGDWNGDGKDTVGVYRRTGHTFRLFQDNTATAAVHTAFAFGVDGDRPLVGDWKLTSTAPTTGQVANAYGYYVNPDSGAERWLAANPTDSRAGAIRSSIAKQASGKWFGSWNPDVGAAVKSYVDAAGTGGTAGKVPVVVADHLPGRECDRPTTGGAATPEAYRTWIAAFAAGIGNRPAVVILEPNALAQIDCLPEADRQVRLDLLRYATEQLQSVAPRAWTYLDAGRPAWIEPSVMAGRLHAAGVANVRGYAVNVSSFYPTDQSTTYAQQIYTVLDRNHGLRSRFIIDTSRNGADVSQHPVEPGAWCNPAQRRLGEAADLEPTPQIANAPRTSDMGIWVKPPGISDGPCGSAPTVAEGAFSPELAMALINGT